MYCETFFEFMRSKKNEKNELVPSTHISRFLSLSLSRLLSLSDRSKRQNKDVLYDCPFLL